jgi:hypothetical protein
VVFIRGGEVNIMLKSLVFLGVCLALFLQCDVGNSPQTITDEEYAELQRIKYYTITPFTDEQGNRVKADPSTAKSGDTVALSVSPAAGYTIKSGYPKLLSESSSSSPPIVSPDNTFTMTEGDLKIDAEFTLVPAAPVSPAAAAEVAMMAAANYTTMNAGVSGNVYYKTIADAINGKDGVDAAKNPVQNTEVSKETITLIADADISAEITISGRSITLQPFDGVVTLSRGTPEGSLFTVEGGSLTLESGITLDGNKGKVSASSALVKVKSGVFTMKAGVTLQNNDITDGYGGGVVVEGGEFTMSGGAISGNTASKGGGVYQTGGTFMMLGGAVSGNEADSGGGVYVETAVFTMSGDAVINGNTAASDGGGVWVNSGEFTMKSGVVSGNKADSGSGGGVFVGYKGGFNKNDGTVYGTKKSDGLEDKEKANTASSGAALYNDGGTVNIDNKKFTDNAENNTF